MLVIRMVKTVAAVVMVITWGHIEKGLRRRRVCSCNSDTRK